MPRRPPEIPYPQDRYRLFGEGILVYVERDGKCLMIHRNRFRRATWYKRWSGVMGRKECKKFIIPQMEEMLERQAGIRPTKFIYYGIIETYYTNNRYWRCYVFRVTEFEGEPKDKCIQGTLKWVKFSRIPKLNLMPVDRRFLKTRERNMRFVHLMLEYKIGEDGRVGDLEDAVLNTRRVPLEDWNNETLSVIRY